MPNPTQLKTNKFRAPESAITHPVRAKFYPTSSGIPRLAQVQKFATAHFREDGWEAIDREDRKSLNAVDVAAEIVDGDRVTTEADVRRATRRAKINAFDLIMCNHDLDTFVTFTYSPDEVDDKASYDECYESIAVWLSNRVQRRGLKYVMVPERTKRGDIHFHAIMNSGALKLAPAQSAKSGRVLTHNGKPLWNVPDWKFGFTSAELIGAADGDRAAVSKYIFKYMGKQMGQKIGGRYVLTGGKLARPLYAYGESEYEFFSPEEVKDARVVDVVEAGISYWEYSFI